MPDLTDRLASDFLADVYPAVEDLKAALSSAIALRDEPAGSRPLIVLGLVARWRVCAEVLAGWEPLGWGLKDLLAHPEPVPSEVELASNVLEAFAALPPLPGTLLAEARRALEAENLPRLSD